MSSVDREAVKETVESRHFESGYVFQPWTRSVAGYRWRSDLVALGASDDEGEVWLVAESSGAERITLARRWAVLSRAFLRLAERPTDDAIRNFASKWGLMGPGTALRPRGDNEYRGLAGESRSEWLDQLARYRMLHVLWEDAKILRNPDSYGLTRAREAERGVRVVREDNAIRLELDAKHHGTRSLGRGVYVVWPGEEEAFARLIGAKSQDVALFYVAREVNKHLGRVQPVLLPFLGMKLRESPTSLLAALYLGMAQEMAGGARPERPCEFSGCGRSFLPGRIDQRYCSDSCRVSAAYHRRVARPEASSRRPS